jgi:hypothetical protein
MNRPFAFGLIVFAAASLLIQGCRTGKAAVEKNHKVENLQHPRLIDSIAKHHVKIEYFSTRASTDMKTKDQNLSFKTNLKIRHDSLIWFNIQAFGAVLYSGIISTDTVVIADKRSKQYWAGGFTYINELLNNSELDYFMMQDILLGNLVHFDAEEKYKMKEDTSYYFISTVGKRRFRKAFEKERFQKKEPYIYRYWIYPENFRPYMTIINDLTDSTSLELTYKSYENVDSVLVPVDFTVMASGPNQKIELQLNYKSTRINEATEYTFSIPEGYEKME